MSDARRRLPSIGVLLESAGVRALLETTPRNVVVNAVRDVVNGLREGDGNPPEDQDAWTRAIASRVADVQRPSLRRVINATGIVLHTNLGRAPLAPAALDAIARVASGYSNLEYDLDQGARGSRYSHCTSLLRELTGAEDALVVNNCAAALVLTLNTIAEGRDALLSRGELVEIGGSFRVHEIMSKSGARLLEVGATNRTHPVDYVRALSDETGAILKVHRSNFAQAGFVAEVPVRELAIIASPREIPIVHDLGSGLLISLESLGLVGEPTAREALEDGASIVVMSGDKLLGGPQAGIVLGNSRILQAMRRNPLVRSYRVDKLTLAALEATLALYREPARAMREIPTLAMIAAKPREVRERVESCVGVLTARGMACDAVDTVGSVGAGAFPTTTLESFAIALTGDAETWASRLRGRDPAVIGRVHDGRLLLDFRAVSDADADDLLEAVLASNV